MKIFKPYWVNHDDKPIFSLDIHPDGSRVATGGQGNDCGRVAIWNMAPIMNEAHERDAAVPKMFCQMDNHLGCVNCVRWCQDGSMLASGGDDKIIMIWKRSKGTGSSFGGFTKSHENWRCVHTLRGHEGDILDLAWSPGDRWLASSSVDNSVFIWDVSTTATPCVLSILKGHVGLVKGVAWDPVGKYVASQSDDRTVKIWKTADWACDSTITEPFVECGGTTHVLRLSWSPDGQYLVSAHAMNGGGPTAQIIDREGWKCDKDFVGHRKAVTCVRFHSSIMMRTATNSKTQQYCCLGIGSRDKSLSVWMTALQRPLVVIYDVFDDSVLDISWSTNGYTLMACSGEGTVASVQFTEKDLGTPLSELDKNSLYQRMYGKGVYEMNVSTDKDVIIENAELLNSASGVSLPGLHVKRPVADFLTPELTTSPENYTRIASRMDNKCESSSSSITSSSVAVTASPAKQAIHKQIETRTKDGKRRITPMFIPINQDLEPEDPVAKVRATEAVQSVAKPQDYHLIGEKGRDQQNGLDGRLAKIPLDSPARTNSSLLPGVQVNSVPRTVVQRPGALTIRDSMMSNVRSESLNAGVTRTVGTKRIILQNNFQKATTAVPTPIHRVSCYENHSGGKTLQGDAGQQQPLWQFVTGSAISHFNCCARYMVIGCVDGSVHCLDINYGALVLPVVTLANVVAQSAFSLREDVDTKDSVGVVTETGLVRIWDLETKKSDLAISCYDLLQVTPTGESGPSGSVSLNPILLLAITTNGTPIIVLGNGTSFCYARHLESWLVLIGKDLLQQRALIRCAPSANMSIAMDLKQYPLASIQATVLGMLPSSVVHLTKTNQTGSVPSDWEIVAQLTFIENQLKLCEAIQSPTELRYWYSYLGSTLAQGAGTETRMRHLLDDLLGPSYAATWEEHQKRQILGISKLELLRVVLDHIKGYSKWQRISMEYGDQLNGWTSSNNKATASF